jgi:hypothetical protein
MWGSEPYWGLSYDWDPDWTLTERQVLKRALAEKLLAQAAEDEAKEPIAR